MNETNARKQKNDALNMQQKSDKMKIDEQKRCKMR